MNTNRLVKRYPTVRADMGPLGPIDIPVVGCYNVHVYSEKGRHLGKFVIQPKKGYEDVVYTEAKNFVGDYILSADDL